MMVTELIRMPKRTPPTHFPDAAALQYFYSIRKLIKEMHKMTLSVFDGQIRDAFKEYKQEIKTDSYEEDDALDVIRYALELMKSLSLGIFPSDKIHEIASQFFGDVSRYSLHTVGVQGRVNGINPTENEPWLESFKRAAIAENVTYIKNISDEYAKSVEAIVFQGVKNGQNMKEVRQNIQYRLDISENRAKLIAVDQAGSAFGQMNARRHQDMGVKKFKWSTSKDERVRPRHKELDNKVFDYEDPPSEGMPGTPIRCRCVAIPVFDDAEDEDAVIEFKDNKQVKDFFQTDKFINSLSTEEYQAINTYTSEDYTEINGYLRGKGSRIHGSPPNNLKVEKVASSISAALKKSPINGNIILYRAVGSFNFIKNLQVGKTFTDYGFISTTPLKDSTFIENSKTLMHIHVPIGTNCAYIDPISEYPGEEEVLLDKGTTFKIKEIIDDRNFICEVMKKMNKDEKDLLKTDSEVLDTDDRQSNKEKVSKRAGRFTWQEEDVVFD